MTIVATKLKSPETEKTSIRSISSDVEKMFEDKAFSDFDLKCNDGEVLKAHKVILAARSQVFHAMLTNDMKESKEGFVDVCDFDSKVMKEVLRFMYRNKVEELKEMSQTLIFAAEKYELEELKELCIDSLIASLTTGNVFETLLIADRVSKGEKFFEKCVRLIFKLVSI